MDRKIGEKSKYNKCHENKEKICVLFIFFNIF